MNFLFISHPVHGFSVTSTSWTEITAPESLGAWSEVHWTHLKWKANFSYADWVKFLSGNEWICIRCLRHKLFPTQRGTWSPSSSVPRLRKLSDIQCPGVQLFWKTQGQCISWALAGRVSAQGRSSGNEEGAQRVESGGTPHQMVTQNTSSQSGVYGTLGGLNVFIGFPKSELFLY
jgi:hypothetical protein